MPEDSQVVMLCVLDVFLGLLLYILFCFCPQVAMINKYVVLSVLCQLFKKYLIEYNN